MRRASSHRLSSFVLPAATLLLVALLVPAPSLRAGSPPAPGNSKAFGQSLGDWMISYTAWYLGSTAIAPDANGNADVGRVVLLALPATPGDGTPGSLDVTFEAGQPFVLPFSMWIGNSYADGSVDPLADVGDFSDMDIVVKLDGVPIVTSKNVGDYYTEGVFNPPLTTDLPPGATGWVFVQSVGMVHGPLTPGRHVLTVDESVDFSDLGLTAPVVYHNTWQITVRPGR